MKKNKIFILIISLFCIFAISDKVEALTFNVNGVNYSVTNNETARDYVYYKYTKPNNYEHLVMFCSTTSYFYCYGVTGGFSNIWANGYSKTTFTPCMHVYYINKTTDRYDGCLIETSNITKDYIFPYYRTLNIYNDSSYSNIYVSSNLTLGDIDSKYGIVETYDIKYYLNNELYDTIIVEGGSSHTLKSPPTYDSSTQNWSGWTYDSNINLSNITSDFNIYGTVSDKSSYIITYYINNEVYRTESVYEGNSYTLLNYTPLKNYNFSGWTYDENYNFNSVNENMSIYGTSVFVRPTMHYSEEIDSTIHSLSVSILGREIPVEFDFLYTIMDFIILILLVICVIAPFIIVFKLLGGGF